MKTAEEKAKEYKTNVSRSFIMEFNECTSLKTVDISNLDFSKSSRMVMLDEMTFKQVEWCKEKGIIENLKPEVAKQLNMCAFYAMIPSELIGDFEAL